MNIGIQRNGTRISLFLLAAVCAYAVSSIALFSIPAHGKEFLSSIAIPFDLMVVLPALFYFLVIRKNGLSPLLVLPIIALGSAFVFQIAQPGNLIAVFAITVLVVIVDVSIGIRGFVRLVGAYRAARSQSDDPTQWFIAPLYDLLRNRRASKLLSAELSTMYYTFFSWRKKPMAPQGSKTFTYHKESGYIALMGVLLCLIPIETAIVHFLLSRVSVEAAWVLTILSAYSALWLFGDCRASVLRPISISDDTLSIHSGVRFSTNVPLSALDSIGSTDPGFAKELTANMGIMGSPNTWITFSHDVEIETFTGSKRKIRSIGLTIDNAPSFKEMISESIQAR